MDVLHHDRSRRRTCLRYCLRRSSPRGSRSRCRRRPRRSEDVLDEVALVVIELLARSRGRPAVSSAVQKLARLLVKAQVYRAGWGKGQTVRVVFQDGFGHRGVLRKDGINGHLSFVWSAVVVFYGVLGVPFCSSIMGWRCGFGLSMSPSEVFQRADFKSVEPWVDNLKG